MGLLHNNKRLCDAQQHRATLDRMRLIFILEVSVEDHDAGIDSTLSSFPPLRLLRGKDAIYAAAVRLESNKGNKEQL